jgi:rubrerythrin
MMELSVRDILHHAQKIEQESHAFYTGAESRASDPGVRELLGQLASSEVAHFNRLRSLLEEGRLSADELAATARLDGDSPDRLVPVRPLPEGASTPEVLSIALEREKSTRGLYQRLLALTNLSAELSGTFEYLLAQETGHVRLIEGRLRAL